MDVRQRSDLEIPEDIGRSLPSLVGEIQFDLLSTKSSSLKEMHSGEASEASMSFGTIHHAGIQNSSCSVKLDELQIFLPHFEGNEGENVDDFIRSVEHTRKTFHVGEEIMKLLIFKQLKGNAQKWLNSYQNRFSMSLSEFFNLLKTTFSVSMVTFELRKKT